MHEYSLFRIDRFNEFLNCVAVGMSGRVQGKDRAIPPFKDLEQSFYILFFFKRSRLQIAAKSHIGENRRCLKKIVAESQMRHEFRILNIFQKFRKIFALVREPPCPSVRPVEKIYVKFQAVHLLSQSINTNIIFQTKSQAFSSTMWIMHLAKRKQRP